jgi:hypothetical protein
MMNQADQVLSVLKDRGAISPQTALRELGIMRLAARCHELRQLGHPIVSQMVESKSRGRIVRHAVYRLAK